MYYGITINVFGKEDRHMKKLFMEPALTVDTFASEDVIAASYEGVDGNDNGGDDIF